MKGKFLQTFSWSKLAKKELGNYEGRIAKFLPSTFLGQNLREMCNYRFTAGQVGATTDVQIL